VYGNSLLNAPNGNILGMLPNNWATKMCAAMLLIHLFSAFLVCSRWAVTYPWQRGGGLAQHMSLWLVLFVHYRNSLFSGPFINASTFM
jgi:hypothetical protein